MSYPGGNNPSGFVNDAHAWPAILKDKFGIPAANVKILLEDQARPRTYSCAGNSPCT